VVADRDQGNGIRAAEEIKRLGAEALFIPVEVSSAASVENLLNRTLLAYGRLDCAINNAGINPDWIPLHEQTEEGYDRVLDINLKGVFLCMKYEIIQFLRHGGGTIVNMSSGLGLVAMANLSPYIASKHGIIGLTRAAAMDYAQQKIRVNAICPGVVLTPLMPPEMREDLAKLPPMRRLGAPQEIAAAASWLCSDESSYVTGTTLSVDGGYTTQ
jgi:NAD(P)-dependent dehydrogenase (short-subunit alcohol dehydrogenase family)